MLYEALAKGEVVKDQLPPPKGAVKRKEAEWEADRPRVKSGSIFHCVDVQK